jgi:hypothetical protein
VAEDRLRTVDEHLALVLEGIGTIEPIELHLLDAQGLLLAEDVVSEVPLPGFDNSAMDGYAVRAVDTREASAEKPTELPVVGDVVAGSKSRGGMGPGVSMRIMTGAPIPAGADGVIPLEDTDRGVARVAIRRPVRSGECIRRAGEDLPAGARALAAGSALGPQQVALLAAIGRDRVLVHPRPRVIVISTGSEVQIALEARERLEAEGTPTRVVSMPCREWFEAQDASYRQQVLPPEVKARVSVEAAVALGWRDFVGDHGECLSIEHYGASAPYKILYKQFGLTPDRVVAAAHASLSKVGATSGSTTGN